MRTASGLLCIAFCLFVGLPQSKAGGIACGTVAGNLVLNCGFETGDFTSWTLSGNDVPAELNNLYGVEGVDPINSISPNHGSDQVFIADLDSNATTLSQVIATTSGANYTVTLWLAQDTDPASGGGTYSNAFSASFNGLLVSLTNVPVEGYSKYSYTTTASSASTTLSLTLGNDLGEFLLDDISVVQQSSSPTPEPAAWTLALGGAMLLLTFHRKRATRRDVL